MYKRILVSSIAVSSAVLGMGATAAQGAPSTGPGSDGPDRAPLMRVADAIPGRYIVMLDNELGTKAVRNAADRARTVGGSVVRSYPRIGGYAAELSQAELDRVRADARVAYVEPDQIARASTEQTNATWGIDRIDQRSLPLSTTYNYTATGAGVTAYIIDTGLNAGHSEFTGRVGSGYDTVGDGRGTADCNGHGTHVAGTVAGTRYGVAKQATVVPVRVLNCEGSGSYSGIIAGMDWVAGRSAANKVANMSLGGGASSAVDDAVNRMISAGVTTAVAAGNEDQNACNVSPARTPNAITVASSTNSDDRSSFSNWGSCTDIFAPGSNITSAWTGSSSATNTISGTSMATPHVVGAAALYLDEHPGSSPAQVTSAMLDASTSGAIGDVAGSPNRLLYTGTGTDGGDPDPQPTECSERTGSASLTGGSYAATASFTAAAGTHKGCLDGPAGSDLDLYLQRLSGGYWTTVAAGETSSADEKVTYTGTAGTYRWRVYAYSGGGSFSMKWDIP